MKMFIANDIHLAKNVLLLIKYYNNLMTMQKRVKINANNINKAQDKQYVFYTYELMIKSLYDYQDIVTKIFFDKTGGSFTLAFTLKICKTGDMLWILMKEFLSTILETENKVAISISEVDEGCKSGIIYKFYNYVPTDDNDPTDEAS